MTILWHEKGQSVKGFPCTPDGELPADDAKWEPIESGSSVELHEHRNAGRKKWACVTVKGRKLWVRKKYLRGAAEGGGGCAGAPPPTPGRDKEPEHSPDDHDEGIQRVLGLQLRGEQPATHQPKDASAGAQQGAAGAPAGGRRTLVAKRSSAPPPAEPPPAAQPPSPEHAALGVGAAAAPARRASLSLPKPHCHGPLRRGTAAQRSCSVFEPRMRKNLAEATGGRPIGDEELSLCVRAVGEDNYRKVADHFLDRMQQVEDLLRSPEFECYYAPPYDLPIAEVEAVVRKHIWKYEVGGRATMHAELRRLAEEQAEPPPPAAPAGEGKVALGRSGAPWLITRRVAGRGKFATVLYMYPVNADGVPDMESPHAGKLVDVNKVCRLCDPPLPKDVPVRWLGREQKVMETVRHPNVVPLLDYIQLGDDLSVFVMPFLAGGTLQRLLDDRKGSALPMAIARDLFRQIVEGCAAVHRAGFISRDIKPENILLSRPVPAEWDDMQEAVRAVLADVGIAAELVDGVAQETTLGSAVGTYYYMPPESLSGEGDRGGGVDCWACGCILSQFASGQLPFRGNLGDLLTNIPLGKRDMALPEPGPKGATKADREAQWDLVNGLLKVDRAARLTAEAACAHHWLQPEEERAALAELTQHIPVPLIGAVPPEPAHQLSADSFIDLRPVDICAEQLLEATARPWASADPELRAAVWVHREGLAQHRSLLGIQGFERVARCLQRGNAEHMRQAAAWAGGQWPGLPAAARAGAPREALQLGERGAVVMLLSPLHCPAARSLGARCVRGMPAADLCSLMGQLLQALRWDTPSTGAEDGDTTTLHSVLLERAHAADGQEIHSTLWWWVKGEIEGLERRTRHLGAPVEKGEFEWDKLRRELEQGPREHQWQHQGQLELLRVFRNLRDCDRHRGMACQRETLRRNLQDRGCGIKKLFSGGSEEDGAPQITSPLDPTLPISGISEDGATFFGSAHGPMLLTLLLQGGGTRQLILKSGDDLRRDAFVMQIISILNKGMQDDPDPAQRADLRLTAYRIMPTGPREGLIECIRGNPQSVLHCIRHRPSYLDVLEEHAKVKEQGGADSEMLENWIISNAAYLVITYIVGVGDRHLENLLVTDSGMLVHIDFGFILGQDPHWLDCRPKLRREMVAAMGGPDSCSYQRFVGKCAAFFSLVRRESGLLLALLHGLSHAKCDDGTYLLTGGRDPRSVEASLEYVAARLMLGASEAEASQHMTAVVARSLDAWLHQLADVGHAVWH
eukprot:TRINITY_DN4846_c0_g1_i1.p1 TRINITY_DN4846_c0_g1~~TRINITY_DN4846_c0_g1_i1.p1  ORF type:complete len:1254 (+),score=291.79 TRINITY_DN4846_c0_g1_i1:101-3862(+)